jgi:GWxTD domain-containing protein
LARRSLALWLLAAASGAAAFAHSDKGSDLLLAWARGPVRWLLLPSEWRELKALEDPADKVNFVEAFWRLRDPDPATEENEFRAQFASRVEAADLLYTEGDTRGSLTDRGRALILLGSPPRLRIGTEVGLAFKPGRRSGKRSTTREIRVEVWSYPEEQLPEKLVRVLRAAELEPSVVLKFRLGRNSAQLMEGADSLILAARLTLVQD